MKLVRTSDGASTRTTLYNATVMGDAVERPGIVFTTDPDEHGTDQPVGEAPDAVAEDIVETYPDVIPLDEYAGYEDRETETAATSDSEPEPEPDPEPEPAVDADADADADAGDEPETEAEPEPTEGDDGTETESEADRVGP